MEVKGRGPEPMKAKLSGCPGVGRNAVRREASRRERSV